MKNLDGFKDDYFNIKKVCPEAFDSISHREFQYQSPYDLIAKYTPEEQKMLVNFCKENFKPIKAKKLSTGVLKNWARDCLEKYGFNYVSAGAIKGALLLSGFNLTPYEFNARVNISSASYIRKRVFIKYGVARGHS